MDTNIRSSKESIVRVQEFNDFGVVPCGTGRACLQFMPKVLQKESEIKEVLDHQLCNLRTINTDPRAASYDMAGLTSSFNFDSEERNTKSNEMWKTGKVLIEVNAMPGLVSDESDREESYGCLHAMQPNNGCFYCKCTGHTKRDCRKFAE